MVAVPWLLTSVLVAVLLHPGEGAAADPPSRSAPPSKPGEGALRIPAAARDRRFETERRRMVEEQVEARGVHHPGILEIMRVLPRHRFVSESLASHAYQDRPLPIGEGQTISQPYVQAWMTEILDPRPGEKVLEIGTGSGYQTALLAALGARVYTVEVLPDLAHPARRTLESLGFEEIRYRIGDGSKGWPEEAPFDAILMGCAADRVPPVLVEQLAPGGRLLFPMGPAFEGQDLTLVRKTEQGLRAERLGEVLFVPMKGGAVEPPRP